MSTQRWPTTAHVLERAGCRLHYWLTGPDERPLIVLTHGLTLDHRMFDPQVPALAGDYRVLTWDLRGQGRSQPIGTAFTIGALLDDLLAILDQVGRQRAIIVGYSLGGIVAQELAFRFPRRVLALVAFGCSCITLPIPWHMVLAMRLAPLPLRLMRFVPYWPMLRLSAAQMAERPEVRVQVADMLSRVSQDTFLKLVTALARCMHGEPGYGIELPLLIAYGECDRYGDPKRAAKGCARRDRQARVAVIPNAGHNANQDNPEAFNALLLDFLHTHPV